MVKLGLLEDLASKNTLVVGPGRWVLAQSRNPYDDDGDEGDEDAIHLEPAPPDRMGFSSATVPLNWELLSTGDGVLRLRARPEVAPRPAQVERGRARAPATPTGQTLQEGDVLVIAERRLRFAADVEAHFERLATSKVAEQCVQEALRLADRELAERLVGHLARVHLRPRTLPQRRQALALLEPLTALAPSAVDALLATLAEADENLRCAAVAVVGRSPHAHGQPRLREALLGLLGDDSERVFVAAESSLETARDVDLRPRLEALLGRLPAAVRTWKGERYRRCLATLPPAPGATRP